MMFYHWITLSSMIILMLFMRRNLRLKTLQMFQNGLIILTVIWSLMRSVHFSHSSLVSYALLFRLYVCHPFGLSPFWPVAVMIGGRQGLSTWSVICIIFSMWIVIYVFFLRKTWLGYLPWNVICHLLSAWSVIKAHFPRENYTNPQNIHVKETLFMCNV